MVDSTGAGFGHFKLWPTAISTLERGLRRDDELASAYREWLNAS
ncbi:hypothetical protein [Streptomyces sp. NPDC004330]